MAAQAYTGFSSMLKSVFVVTLFAAAVAGADFQAGFGRVDITPPTPIPLSGFAARKVPAESVGQRIFAKALALQDPSGERTVIVTMDLIVVPLRVAEDVAARVRKRSGIHRNRLLFNCSHTHSGPQVVDTRFAWEEAPGNATVIEYTHALADKLASVIDDAVRDLAPATIEIGHGTAGFAINRRQSTPTGVRIGTNPEGPKDHDVPVLRVTGKDGKLRGVLFGYACHNTTLTAQFVEVSGDYAGFAQKAFEEAHPGATAMFLLLCGGDQNPNPRGTRERAEQYGKELAGAVEQAMRGTLKPLRPPVRAAFEVIDLPFPNYSREYFQGRVDNADRVVADAARYQLGLMDKGITIRSLTYPVQVLRFGKDLTLIALGGETLIDYAVRLKREYAGEDTIVAGYSNDVFAYIPSRRVIKEGGYEADSSQYYSGLPGPFREDIEDIIVAAVRKAMRQVGRKAK